MKRVGSCLLALFLLSAPPQVAQTAVALLYHHVSEDTPASTSVSPVVFADHLDMIESGGYEVWRLGRILSELRAGRELPPKTVAITFDDAYISIYETAWPALRERGWPFTVFVNTDAVDAGYARMLSWEQLREMRDAGMETGNHSASHAHLVRREGAESESAWLARVRKDIERAAQRLEQEIGSRPRLFAYPYGEYDEALLAVVENLALVGIAQQSGAIGAGFDPLAVPRFPMAGAYATPERFRASLMRRPLPVLSVSAGSLVQRESQTARAMEFGLADGDFRASQLACYASTGEALDLSMPKHAGGRYRVSLPALAAGRRKVNCTAPHQTLPGVFYWYSRQWLVQHSDGSWYRE